MACKKFFTKNNCKLADDAKLRATFLPRCLQTTLLFVACSRSGSTAYLHLLSSGLRVVCFDLSLKSTIIVAT